MTDPVEPNHGTEDFSDLRRWNDGHTDQTGHDAFPFSRQAHMVHTAVYHRTFAAVVSASPFIAMTSDESVRWRHLS